MNERLVSEFDVELPDDDRSAIIKTRVQLAFGANGKRDDHPPHSKTGAKRPSHATPHSHRIVVGPRKEGAVHANHEGTHIRAVSPEQESAVLARPRPNRCVTQPWSWGVSLYLWMCRGV
jgi:hypothetical protein